MDQPNRAWCCDLFYLWTVQGWFYLAAVIALYSRKVAGWADSQSGGIAGYRGPYNSFLALKTCQGPVIFHHSDSGSQYGGINAF